VVLYISHILYLYCECINDMFYIYDLPTSSENRDASFRTICPKISKTTIIQHYSMFKKKICFQNIPAEYKKYDLSDILNET